MAFTPEQEVVLAKMADDYAARSQAEDARAANVKAARAALAERQERLRADAKGLDPKSREYRDLVSVGDAEVAALVEAVKAEEVGRGDGR